jgi:HTH-type transcriptional repressor of NAD biosynthesis genes
MTNRKVGLTLGKFAPLHRGHQSVIETAIAEMDEVIVVIYDCPETTPIPLTVRAGWIRTLYPGVTVLEAWDGPTEVGYTPEIKRSHEAYILAKLGGRQVSHFYSSEFYGDHMSQALGAVNRQVDPQRQVHPVSGTMVRQSPYEHRQFLAPVVYRDLVTNVVFLGAPSTGKSTLTERMARELDTVWMPEYGREYWEQHHVDRRLAPAEMVTIAEGHLEREERLLQDARGYLFTDTNAITTYMFAVDYHSYAEPRLAELAGAASSRYDLVFVCGDEIPYADTWDRSGDAPRHRFQKQIVADLILRKIPFIPLAGTLEARVGQVKSVLSRYTKYRNLGELMA